jgi:L-cysteine S-thiosulfotransferase
MTRLMGMVSLLLAAGLAGCMAGPRSGAGLRLPDGDVDHGRVVFVEMKCYSCHRVAGLDDLPEPVADPPVPVMLGGDRPYPRTDGDILTAIVNPSHRIVPAAVAEQVQSGNLSRMGDYSDSLTVRELVDLVAFVQSHYRVVRPPDYALR